MTIRGSFTPSCASALALALLTRAAAEAQPAPTTPAEISAAEQQETACRKRLDHAGLLHSDQLKTQERDTLSADGETINGTVRVEDPGFYAKPWTTAFIPKNQPGFSLRQFACMADHKM